jgi:glyoxylase-like metal-dependent hydrolase (beta-lactamase superfamily II)
MRLKILKIGDLLLEASEEPDISLYMKKLEFGSTGASTVTLVQGEKTLLIDTGFEEEVREEKNHEERNHEKLKTLLNLEGLSPRDIDYVFFTHLHRDHTGNYGLFDKSTFFMSAYEYERSSIPQSEPLNDTDEIMEGVSVMLTPGHTRGHCSVKVELEPTIVIAGDALVSLAYLLKDKFWCYNQDYYSDKASRESLKKILDTADYIIPGHGSIFKNVRTF